MAIFEQDWGAEARVLGYSSEKEMLRDLYFEQGFSIKQISVVVGYSAFNVRKRLLMFLGAPLRTRGGPNNLGKRVLREVTDEKLASTPTRELAESYKCHPATITAERKLREKMKVEEGV